LEGVQRDQGALKRGWFGEMLGLNVSRCKKKLTGHGMRQASRPGRERRPSNQLPLEQQPYSRPGGILPSNTSAQKKRGNSHTTSPRGWGSQERKKLKKQVARNEPLEETYKV